MTGPIRDPLPFDRVVLAGRTYTAEEFLHLPLSQRVRHILKHEVTFLKGDVPIRSAIALGGLRAAATKKNGA